MTDLGPDLHGPVFIVGCPRSGTTLLQQLLSRHPDVVIAPETHFMRRFYDKRREYGDLSSDGNWTKLLDAVVRTPEFTEMGLDDASFRAACVAGPRSFATAFAAQLQLFARAQHATTVGEKTPHHMLHLRRLKQWFPGAQFVSIMRDPRAVAQSTRQVWWSSGTLRGDARVWRRYARALHRHGDAVGAVRITYEELVSAPDLVLSRLLDRLHLTAGPTQGGASSGPVALNVEREPWKADSAGPVHAERAERWRSQLTAAELVDIEAVTWRDMRREGYRPVSRYRDVAVSATIEEFLLAGRELTNVFRRRGTR